MQTYSEKGQGEGLGKVCW